MEDSFTMGVRKLSAYIEKNQNRYLRKYELYNCFVIIDGSSLAYQLFNKFVRRPHCAFGGDYDIYAQQIKEFFDNLFKCKIKPIVIFDGGYELKKVTTVISRIGNKIDTIKNVIPCSLESEVAYPLFLKVVFKQTIASLNIPLIQCDFEADKEIASLANKYNCPVISYDSDFYIFDVNYIPISTIELEPAPVAFKISNQLLEYCLKCKIYRVDFLIGKFSGLDKSTLPILACFLGNDYGKVTSLNKINLRLNNSKKGKKDEVIRVIKFLLNQTVDSAIEKIVSRTKKIKHNSIKRSIIKVVDHYSIDPKTTIELFLPEDFKNSKNMNNLVDEFNFINSDMVDMKMNNEDSDVDMDEDILDDADEYLSSNSDDDYSDEIGNVQNENEMEVDKIDDRKKKINKINKLPNWLLSHFNKGEIESCVSDIIKLFTYFTNPQVEDKSCKSSHFISLPIIKIIGKLLLGDSVQEISLWCKNDSNKLQRFLLLLSDTVKITDIVNVPNLTATEKQILLLNSLNVPAEFKLHYFPHDWRLYICAIVFWIKNCKHAPVRNIHLVSVLVSIITLDIVDSKIGFIRKKSTFFKKYGKLQKTVTKRIEFGFSELDNEEDAERKESQENINAPYQSENIENSISLITLEECVAVFTKIHQFHLLNEDMKKDKSLYSKENIHTFAQFQSCLYHVMVLNSILGFPFKEPIISHLYCGTFIYNLFISLNDSKNTWDYLHSLFFFSPNIIKLIRAMVLEINRIIEVPIMEQIQVKKNRRRKRKRNNSSYSVIESDNDNDLNQNAENDYFDENNSFSILGNL